MKKKILSGLFLVLILLSMSHAGSIKICTDLSNWYPFTFTKTGRSAGMHVDIVVQALKNLGYEMEFTPKTWDNCIRMTGDGTYDALVSGSYKAKRAKRLMYPPDATEKTSEWRIMQVAYVLVTHRDYPTNFDGDRANLPKPLRAPRGYSIVDDLRKGNIKVITGNTRRNMEIVNRMKKGGVITIPSNAKMLIKKLGFEDTLKVHAVPIKSKSYHMLFSKNIQKLTTEEITKIWQEIAKVRDDESFISKMQEKYD